MENKYKLNRPIERKVRLNEQENEYIKKKIEASPFNNFQNFARTLLIQGEIKTTDYSELFTLNKQVSAIGNNINQVVRLANQFDEISKEDILDLQNQIQEVKDMVRTKINQEMKKNRKGIHNGLHETS
ncbi:MULTISPECIES: plasmid mobilization relaxosome protein MobC [unclassified Lactococcus]|uniref:plasmid mobilization protein n=1 Tax=unclassified Lactococcus TaxID=2643510 RepID=UPI0011CC2DD2|nr:MULTISPECIES: plasmid mobilization relaxosome protein MobC [unclassified Lactococcus]MQW23440.1 plasmid mobilization relaxosome protein MobC [Lactococcus sp. dk101]TXK37048.1 MobC family plasmid mobilization relaxosome protein [Lactococcus sp. dk310]TXK37280.1 MobC family plasmid mobilization relaxosome protein [Lactococcus sp. dk310]TXK47724.1 MobC family plasmid mobilization relaxosome protein [Lactococcus sp. dk322]